MTPHVAEARRAAAQLLWAAVGGAEMTEAVGLMQFACEIWPEPPLTMDKLADSPSPAAWRRVAELTESARTLQEQQCNIDRDKAEAVEALVVDFVEGQKP